MKEPTCKATLRRRRAIQQIKNIGFVVSIVVVVVELLLLDVVFWNIIKEAFKVEVIMKKKILQFYFPSQHLCNLVCYQFFIDKRSGGGVAGEICWFVWQAAAWTRILLSRSTC